VNTQERSSTLERKEWESIRWRNSQKRRESWKKKDNGRDLEDRTCLGETSCRGRVGGGKQGIGAQFWGEGGRRRVEQEQKNIRWSQKKKGERIALSGAII